MDEMKLRKTIIPYMNYICHLSQKQVFSNSFYQKRYFQVSIEEALCSMIEEIMALDSEANEEEVLN
ncbi:MAG TPA: hypothetical protein GXZ28_06905 [Clostridiales bacterium]|jgi:hypothetical protein|nr:hypothetical protein [Clostridiales bacterium]